MGRVVSPTPTPLSSGRVVPALVASYDMHGRAVGLFYTQPTGQKTSHINPLKTLSATFGQIVVLCHFSNTQLTVSAQRASPTANK